jgi:hypothetical protein
VDSVASRPALLGGFWAFLVGGLVLVVAVVYAHPIVDPGHCPNAGAAGNASAFADPSWDLRLPMLALGWLALTVVEQALPTTWRHRPGSAVAGRAALAVSVVFAASCLLLVPLETVCR